MIDIAKIFFRIKLVFLGNVLFLFSILLIELAGNLIYFGNLDYFFHFDYRVWLVGFAFWWLFMVIPLYLFIIFIINKLDEL